MDLAVIGLQVFMLNCWVLNLVWFLLEERTGMLPLLGSEAVLGNLFYSERVITKALG